MAKAIKNEKGDLKRGNRSIYDVELFQFSSVDESFDYTKT
jgi:hypothetical protein